MIRCSQHGNIKDAKHKVNMVKSRQMIGAKTSKLSHVNFTGTWVYAH